MTPDQPPLRDARHALNRLTASIPRPTEDRWPWYEAVTLALVAHGALRCVGCGGYLIDEHDVGRLNVAERRVDGLVSVAWIVCRSCRRTVR